MGKALNVLVGSIATALVTAGVAAQTGTVRWPGFASPSGSGGVQAQQASESLPPTPSNEPSPSPSELPTPVPVAAVPPAPPPAHKKHGR